MSMGADQVREDRKVRPTTLTLVRSDGAKKQWVFCACGELAIAAVGGVPYCPAHFTRVLVDRPR